MSARNLLDLAWVVPALPALGAVVLLLFGKRMGERAGWLATALMTLSFVASVIAFFALRSLSPDARSNVSQGFTWIQAGTFRADFRFLVDPLSSTMTLFVTGVGSLIHLYAIGYMHGDERFSRFFAYLNLFAASMLVLVLGSSFLLTFLGWEGVGLCSYLLISFWFERNSAAVAGKKAFVTNRVGDFGFMIAMFLIFQKLGTLDYSALGSAAKLPQSAVTAIALLLFLGAIGKSAQLPLHIWLPDAMEGPTPVSALIHAATMVTAGVFLLVRAHVFFDASNHAGTVVAWVGAITALFAATVALVQNDIKRVLAYSTISQLGYMFLAVGVGAYSAAIFHMVTHAFFKALLFLGAGSVIHGMHDEQDMRRMGGLRKYMPITAGTFIFGWLAIAGIFPFAGFWSKDEILAKAWFSHDYALWVVGVSGALITAFYMTRQVWLVFYGPERWRDDAALVQGTGDAHEGDDVLAEAHAGALPHESPWTMYVPLVALALLSFFGGVIDLPFTNAKFNVLDRWLELPEAHVASSFGLGLLLSTIAVAVGVIGIYLGVLLYRDGLRRDGTDPGVERLGGFAGVLQNAYYLDLGLARFVSGPVTAFARFLSDGVDRAGIDGAVNGIAAGARGWRLTAAAPDRPGAELRARHRAGHGAPLVVRGDAGDVLMPSLLAELTPVASTSSKLGYPLLTFLVFLPAIGALVAMIVPARRPELTRSVGYVTSVATFGMALFLLTQFDTNPLKPGYQLLEDHSWIGALGVRWTLGVDGISLFMVALSALLFPIALLASAHISKPKSFTIWMLLLESAMIGVFLALDAVVFFIFFEFVLVPMYFLIAGWGHDNRRYAAMKFFLFTMAGSAFLFAGILSVAFMRQHSTHVLTFDVRTLTDWAAVHIHGGTAKALFLAFAVGFAVKVPLFPLHTWLPDAHTDAPTAGSVVLAGAMLKIGAYGFLRFAIPFFPQAAVDLAPLLLVLAVVGITYGAIVAAMQPNLKRIIAYSSVAHLGFVVLGVFALTNQGISGGLFTMLSHGLTTGALFLLVGMLYDRRHTYELSDFRGIWKAAPVFGGLFVAATFASIGLPGFSGFVGEFLSLLGAFLTSRWYVVVASTGVILAAVYLLWAVQRAFTGEPDDANRATPDIGGREIVTVLPLLGLSLFLGFYPKPVLDRLQPSVEALIHHVEQNSNYKAPTVPTSGPVAAPAPGTGK